MVAPLIWVGAHMAGKESKSRTSDLPSLRTPTGFLGEVVEKGVEYTNQTLRGERKLEADSQASSLSRCI